MLTLFSPAKINLFLRILCKRADGYHELASLFQAVNLTDQLHCKLSNEDRLTCTDPRLPLDEGNFIIKAANLFRHKTGLKTGIHVHLEKRIPIEAGLGGGSSNAATLLYAMNTLTGNQASQEELAEWSAEIGSDISFFFSTGTAYCTGRGEIVQNKPSLTKTHLIIVKPSMGTSTAAVYKNLNIAELTLRDPLVALESFYTQDPHYFNDLEASAFKMHPTLKEIKSSLLHAGFKNVLLSGSGSSLFCLGNVPMPSLPHCQVFKVQTLQRGANSWYEILS